MERRRQSAMGTRERRTQEARIAALFARPRTCYRAAQCVLMAGALFFSSLLGHESTRIGGGLMNTTTGPGAHLTGGQDRPRDRLNVRSL